MPAVYFVIVRSLGKGNVIYPHLRITGLTGVSCPGCTWQVLTEASMPRIHAAVLRTLLLLVAAAAFELPPALLADMRAWALVSMRSAADNAGSADLPTKDLFHIQVRNPTLSLTLTLTLTLTFHHNYNPGPKYCKYPSRGSTLTLAPNQP